MAQIVRITRKKISSEKLYNLAVEDDESYIANGVVVHNCRSLLIPITIYEQMTPSEKVGKQDINAFIEENKGVGFPKR